MYGRWHRSPQSCSGCCTAPSRELEKLAARTTDQLKQMVGSIIVVFSPEINSGHMMALAVKLARGERSELLAIYVIEVPLTLPPGCRNARRGARRSRLARARPKRLPTKQTSPSAPRRSRRVRPARRCSNLQNARKPTDHLGFVSGRAIQRGSLGRHDSGYRRRCKMRCAYRRRRKTRYAAGRRTDLNVTVGWRKNVRPPLSVLVGDRGDRRARVVDRAARRVRGKHSARAGGIRTSLCKRQRLRGRTSTCTKSRARRRRIARTKCGS